MAYPYRIRYRYPRPRHRVKPAEAAAGIAVAAAVIAAQHHGGVTGTLRHAGESLTPPSAATVTSAGNDLLTPAGWAHALLAAENDPQSACNLSAVVAWERAEGGGFGNQAAYNPLNVNPGPGAGWPGHPAIGAWAFPDALTGLRYTVATLGNGDYGAILAAMRAGDSAQAVCGAIMASPWAASRYNGTLTAIC